MEGGRERVERRAVLAKSAVGDFLTEAGSSGTETEGALWNRW